eukprot:7887592-Lingulodinium_polyedra.AAC.1
MRGDPKIPTELGALEPLPRPPVNQRAVNARRAPRRRVARGPLVSEHVGPPGHCQHAFDATLVEANVEVADKPGHRPGYGATRRLRQPAPG